MSDETPKPSKHQGATALEGMSTVDILRLFMSMQEQYTAALKEQTEALRESRKPYVDPSVLEEKKRALEERKQQIALELNRRIATKKQCLHLRTTSDGYWVDGKWNIKWQEHANGIVKGVCGTCFSEFDSRNPEDLKLLRLDAVALRNMGHARGIKQTW